MFYNIIRYLLFLFINLINVVIKKFSLLKLNKCGLEAVSEVMQRSTQRVTRSILERIEEEQEVPVMPVGLHVQPEPSTAEVNVTGHLLGVDEVPRVSAGTMELDVADMLTQKVETLSQARKRLAEHNTGISPKRLRSGYMSFRESQLAKQILDQVTDLEANKENRTDNILSPPRIIVEPVPPQNAEKIVSSMLQEAGLADVQPPPTNVAMELDVQTSQRAASRNKSGRGNRSDSSETPLGSLDRTKVSLGDSEQTTNSKRFIRDQWGTEGTMLKILKFVKIGRKPVTVGNLVSKGPIIAGHRRVIAARCFSSVLKLKQHGFINICKEPNTLEISDISLGPKLTSSQEQI